MRLKDPHPLTSAIAAGFTAGIFSLVIIGFSSSIILSALFRSRYAVELFLIITLCGSLSIGMLTAFGSFKLSTEARRRAAGQCIRCGYDIRATPDQCPECGRRRKTGK